MSLTNQRQVLSEFTVTWDGAHHNADADLFREQLKEPVKRTNVPVSDLASYLRPKRCLQCARMSRPGRLRCWRCQEGK